MHGELFESRKTQVIGPMWNLIEQVIQKSRHVLQIRPPSDATGLFISISFPFPYPFMDPSAIICTDWIHLFLGVQNSFFLESPGEESLHLNILLKVAIMPGE